MSSWWQFYGAETNDYGKEFYELSLIANMYFLSQAYFQLPFLTARNIPSFSLLLLKKETEEGVFLFSPIFLLFTACGRKSSLIICYFPYITRINHVEWKEYIIYTNTTEDVPPKVWL